jgi:hypothetical protein
MNCTQAVWEEALYKGIDLTFEAFEEEYTREYGHPPDEDVIECVDFDEPEYLIGDWQKDDKGLYDVVPRCDDAGYAAILGWLGGAPIVHVVWSETTKGVASMCSPCCPGQADLNSGLGNILAYALPSDFDWDGE